MAFRKGDRVEVASREEGFLGSYYGANIITVLLNGSEYVVEYMTLIKDDDSGELLTEIVGGDEVRPVPPAIPAAGGFRLNEWVDVYANDGWWVGRVTGKRAGKRDCYYVYFETTGEEILYPVFDLRVHLDWCKGKWIVPEY